MSKPANRRRSSSVTTALSQVPLNHQRTGAVTPIQPNSSSEVKPLPAGKPRKKRDSEALPEFYNTKGFVDDLKTGRWMLVPASSFKLMIIGIVAFWSTEYLRQQGVVPSNPFKYLLYLQYEQPNGKFVKGWGDLVFVFWHIVFWSFVRQSVTLHILRPLAKSLGIKGAKIMRFTEQGYAIFYFTITSTIAFFVMKDLPTWWYKTEHFWLGYPHREMQYSLKLYYLLQASYWVQQTILLAGKIEKPRKDFKELVAHHVVTLWLIGWSYNVHLTYIGMAIFLTMDFSDIFLALAKCVNYVNETASQPVFAIFVAIWTYFRHYLNLKILWSVYYEFDLIPEAERTHFLPFSHDLWMAPWMKWQIFVPILLLQIINLFWYFLIWRILIRAIFASPLVDDRSDEEDEPETAEKVQTLKGSKDE